MQDSKNTAHLGAMHMMCTSEKLLLADTPSVRWSWIKRLYLCPFDKA